MRGPRGGEHLGYDATYALPADHVSEERRIIIPSHLGVLMFLIGSSPNRI